MWDAVGWCLKYQANARVNCDNMVMLAEGMVQEKNIKKYMVFCLPLSPCVFLHPKKTTFVLTTFLNKRK